MTVRAVHWHEGMFLWPHQLQRAERFFLEQLHRQHHWDIHYNWGLRSFDWDEAALANYRFAVRSLQARMRDGTVVSIPEDGALSPLDIKDAFDRDNSAIVYLALPKLQAGKPNVAERKANAKPEDEPINTRYVLEGQELEDENTGGDAAGIQVRFLNVKLLLSTQDVAGYDTLPLAKIEKPLKADAVPQLDITYIPPVLACDSWKPLLAGIMQSVYDRLGRKLDLLSRQVVSRGISFDTRNPGDGLLLGQLHALNRGYSLLNISAFADGVHPFQAYTELCRLAGQLAIFHDSHRAPTLPRYDHDDLGGCFYRVKQYLDSIDITEPMYEERPFVGKELRIQVALEPKWLEPIWEVFVGVQSDIAADECIKMLTSSAVLDMKIGSSLRVDEIFSKGSQGLVFTHSPRPPRALPVAPGLVYFQVNRQSKLEEWQNVKTSLTLAIRLNPNRIDGTIDGQTQVSVKVSGGVKTLAFTLFLVQRES